MGVTANALPCNNVGDEARTTIAHQFHSTADVDRIWTRAVTDQVNTLIWALAGVTENGSMSVVVHYNLRFEQQWILAYHGRVVNDAFALDHGEEFLVYGNEVANALFIVILNANSGTFSAVLKSSGYSQTQGHTIEALPTNRYIVFTATSISNIEVV